MTWETEIAKVTGSVFMCEFYSCYTKGIKKQLRRIIPKAHSTSETFLTVSKRQKWVNQTSVPQYRCTLPLTTNCCQADLAWDYTPGLDLTFFVFFWCRHAHRTTWRGLTPLLKKKRADPMLSDPNLPQLPLPTAISLCFPLLFISMAIFHTPVRYWSGVGTYTCGSPQTPPPSRILLS